MTTVAAAQTAPSFSVTHAGPAEAVFSKAVDLNNDGREDFLIVPDGDHSQFFVLLSAGDGTYNRIGPFVAPDHGLFFTSAFGDFNGDGFADIMFVGSDASFATHLYQFLNNGDGSFHFQTKFDAAVSTIAAGDFNHDGKIDIAFASGLFSAPGLKVWFGNGDGSFTIGPTTSFAGPMDEIFMGDFDGDGNADIANIHTQPSSSIPTDVTVFYGDSAGHFTTARVCCSDRETIEPAGDVNGDGITDLIGNQFGGSTNSLNIYFGNKQRIAFLLNVVPIARPNIAFPPAVADMNGDGIPDLVLLETSDANLKFPWFLSLKLGNGDGTYKPEQDIYSSNLQFLRPFVLRANQDSKPDLAILQTSSQPRSFFSDEFVVLMNTSTGNFPACAPPNAFTGITVCSPGATAPSSPVHFSIGAAGQTPMRKVEVWVDGVKATQQLTKQFSNYGFLDADLSISNGTHTVNVFAAGWDNLLEESTFTLTVGSTTPPPAPAPDFALIAAPVISTVKAGQAASYTVNIGSQNGFTAAVSFTCAGLPPSATCVFNPNPLAVTAAGGSSSLQISTIGPSASLVSPRILGRSDGMGLLASISFGVFGICLFAADPRRRKRQRMGVVIFGVLIVMVLLIAGCGGGSSSTTTNTPPPTGGTTSPPPAPSNATPPGTYAVTITATSGTLSHTTTVPLVVQ